MAQVGDKLYALHIWGDGFDRITLHLTPEGVQTSLEEFVNEYWDQEMGAVERDPEDFVEQYFAHVEGESYHRESALIED